MKNVELNKPFFKFTLDLGESRYLIDFKDWDINECTVTTVGALKQLTRMIEQYPDHIILKVGFNNKISFEPEEIYYVKRPSCSFCNEELTDREFRNNHCFCNKPECDAAYNQLPAEEQKKLLSDITRTFKTLL